MVLTTFARKPKPDAGPDCLVCATFARQRTINQFQYTPAATDGAQPTLNPNPCPGAKSVRVWWRPGTHPARRFRTNMVHIRQSRPDSGLELSHVSGEISQHLLSCSSSFGSASVNCRSGLFDTFIVLLNANHTKFSSNQTADSNRAKRRASGDGKHTAGSTLIPNP